MEFNNYLKLIFKYKIQFTCQLFKKITKNLDLVFMNFFSYGFGFNFELKNIYSRSQFFLY